MMSQGCSDDVNMTPCLWPENETVTMMIKTNLWPEKNRSAVNVSTPDPQVFRGQNGLISDMTSDTMKIVLSMILLPATAIFGIFSNSLNLMVYKKHGLKDSITVGLFALSLSDFFMVFFQLVISASNIASNFLPNFTVTAFRLRNMFYAISCSVTVFLSIERCLCVVKPLLVKTLFTKKRAVLVVNFIFAFYIISWSPILVIAQLRKQLSNRNSSLVLTILSHPSYKHFTSYHNAVTGVVSITTIQVIVTVNAVIMIRALYKASRFRMKATSIKNRNELPEIDHGTKTNSHTSPIHQSGSTPRLDGREVRLVKTVVALVLLLSTANAPFVTLKCTQFFVPDPRSGKRYGNLFRLIVNLNNFLASINASVNAIVYYAIGSKYRQTVKDLFCHKKTQKF